MSLFDRFTQKNQFMRVTLIVLQLQLLWTCSFEKISQKDLIIVILLNKQKTNLMFLFLLKNHFW